MAYARSLLGSYDAADDVLQEAMLVVFKKYDQFREGTSVLAWCRSIVRIEVLRTKERNQREQTLAGRLLDDAIDAAFDEYQTSNKDNEGKSSSGEILRRCLERLTKRGQGVLRSRFADELSYPQIGQQLGMTIEAVRKALFRLKKQVRLCVETGLKEMQ